MKKIYIVLSAFAIASLVLFFLIPRKDAFSEVSRFEGKIVRMIEFKGIHKTDDNKEEIVPLLNIDGESILDDQVRRNAMLNSREKPEFNVIAIGDSLTTDKIRDSIKLLFKDGKLSDVRAEAFEYGDGVLIRFYCEERPLVNKIVFKGLDKVQEIDIKEKLLIHENDPFRRDLIEKSLPLIKQKYFESGLYNCVLEYSVEDDPDESKKGVIVTIRIDEGEDIKISKISIVGAVKLNDTDLKSFMELKEDSVLDEGKFDQVKLEQDKMKIIQYYKMNGYLDAEIIDDRDQISYDWADPEEPGKVRALYITLKIREGNRYYFDGYDIQGVTGTIGDKESGRLITTELVQGNLRLRKKDLSDSREMVKKLGLSFVGQDYDPDTVLDYTMLEMDRYLISQEYATYGRIFTQVTPTFEERTANVVINGETETRKYRKYTLTVTEGKEVYIEKIFIKGCKKTKEKVVRREVLVHEETDGVLELYDVKKVELSRQAIYNLGFFKTVNIDARPGTRDDRMNLIITVEEQPTGTVSVGGSWASQSGFSIFADVGEKNFMGNGQYIGVRINYGPTQMSGEVKFVEPWLFDLPVSLETSIFYSRYTLEDSPIFINSDETAEYVKQVIGYSVGPSYRFWYYFNVGVDWTQSWKNIVYTSGNCSDDLFLEKMLGIQLKNAVSLYGSYNSYDNRFNPTRGMSAKIGMSLVGGPVIGGDDHYVKYNSSIEAVYTPFVIPLIDYPIVLAARASGIIIRPPFMRESMQKKQPREKNEWLESEDLLTVGGVPPYGNLRGWDSSDSYLPDSWQAGLYNELLYGGELRFPIQIQYLWGAFFFDAASLWSDPFWEETLSEVEKAQFDADRKSGDLYYLSEFKKADLMNYFRYSYGFGLKVQIPMMPLRFYFGKRLVWDGSSKKFKEFGGMNFQFSIGDMSF